MNKSQRIRVDLNDTTSRFSKVHLEQDVKTLEILSLKLDQKDIYQNFNSDYGVLIGRVLGNERVGIPNAKVSIFIPIEEDDKDDSSIYALYPYENPYDVNQDGKRYNLLPRVARREPSSGAFKPKQPFGSFPIKEEVVTNETLLEVYEKYYKYSTVTNSSGDYMLFGVPIGVQTVHMSVDITDIGKYSMTPADMVTQLGYSENLFTTNNSEIKEASDLNDLPNIETQEISVDVVPFWGDTENYEIGITRQDFRIRATLISNFVIFGAFATQGTYSVWGDPDFHQEDQGFYGMSNNYNINLDMRLNRIGKITPKLYTYPNTVNEEDILSDLTGGTSLIDTNTDIIRVNEKSYYSYIDDGQFLISVPCNRKKIVTDEFGVEQIVSDDSSAGVFSEFLGFVLLESENISIDKTYSNRWDGKGLGTNKPNNIRLRFKIPTTINEEIYATGLTENVDSESDIWRKIYHKFKGGTIYSTSQFFATKYANSIDNPDTDGASKINDLGGISFRDQIGAFRVRGVDWISGNTEENYDKSNGIVVGGNFTYEFPANVTGGTEDWFGGQWINMFMYFPQINWTYGYTALSTRDQNVADMWFVNYKDGDSGTDGEFFTSVGKALYQELVAGEFDTRFFARGNSMVTSFAEVSKADAVNLYENVPTKGGFAYDLASSGITLTGNYLYRTPATTTSKFGYELAAYDDRYDSDPNPYFFKGMYNTDCIKLLFDLNFI